MDIDETFYALANTTRRQILDLVKDNPGCLVVDICQAFTISRVAVMKHLKVLEQANLLISEKVGKERHHYFNVIPIQQIYERWTDDYSRFMASRITDFKRQVEALPTAETEQRIDNQPKERDHERQRKKTR